MLPGKYSNYYTDFPNIFLNWLKSEYWKLISSIPILSAKRYYASGLVDFSCGSVGTTESHDAVAEVTVEYVQV